LIEPIYLINNSFVDNNYGVTGGDNMFALNNLIAGTTKTAMKNVDGNSIISYNNHWLNGVDFDNCNKEEATIFYGVPLLDENFRITSGSACIIKGTRLFIWQGDTVLNISPKSYVGSAPDIGAFEYDLNDDLTELNLSADTIPGEINLTWYAGDGANLLGFEVERSKGGIYMAKIAFVENQGNVTASNKYRYADTGLLPDFYYYRLKRFDSDGRARLSSVLQVELPAPEMYALPPNYPNPFNSGTKIEYHLPTAGYVTLKIFNSLGQEIHTLVDSERAAGYHLTHWNGRDRAKQRVASGTYFLELRVGSFRTTRKLMLLQ
ncbi:MAG: T9SS type A sorting domain-containing protein, partial [candidate division KSB1 bacterium]|nr:T9SS type A sorting domain-containing protein [candidate division KSB1 bacterium]